VKILVLTTWYPSVSDPVRAVFVRRHAQALALHHDVALVHLAPAGTVPVAAAEPGRLSVEHVDASLAPPGSELLGGIRESRRWVRRLQPDLVHTMGFSSLPFGAAVRGGLPWVHTEHWSGVTEPRSAGAVWHAARGARHLLRLPQAVTVVSSDMAGRVAPFARHGAVHVVGNVVDPAKPSPRPRTTAYRLLAVGGLNPIKDPVLAVRTVRVLRERGLEVTLRWAGTGPLVDEVRRAIDEQGVQDQVVLLGQVDPDSLAAHHAWSTEFLLPTRHETFCVAAAEALAHGRPVVLGARGGQRDFVTPDMGALVAGRDPEAFADAIEDVRRRLADMPPAAFASGIERAYSPEAVATRFDEVYAAVPGLATSLT
jgi:glycosyltransferase involved in cell wall biosynthesis